jgi:tetratricopeptide (TPR) repeat protein
MHMRWRVVAACGGATVVAATAFGWTSVHRERDFRALLSQGDQALARRQTAVALEFYSGAVALKPLAMAPYLKRGDTYVHRQEWAAAERDLGRAAALDPGAPQPVERLGDVALATGRFEAAAEHYRNALGIDDRAVGVAYKLALALFGAGDWASAETVARSGLAAAEDADLLYVRGLSLRALGRSAEAATALERSVALSPAPSAARLALADVYQSLGRTRDELAQRESIAALDPDRTGPLVSAALAYARAGRREQAMATLSRAEDLTPNDVALRLARARVWLLLARDTTDPRALQEALGILRPLAQSADAPPDVLAEYGRALLFDGALAAAEAALIRATRLWPLDRDALHLLAEAAARRGHAEAAAAARNQLAALGS